MLCRYAIWLCRGGARIEVPWSSESSPPYSPFAHRRRTRSRPAAALPGTPCALLFWKRTPEAGLDDVLFDIFTGFTGIATVALDFGLETGPSRWVITCGRFKLRGRELDGPHYAPIEACQGASLARVDIAAAIDPGKLLSDLEAVIADSKVRHKGSAPLSYFLGITPQNRVTCSSLIGRAILRQPSQPLAQALRQALKERFTYGEIAPADLARAAAILNLSIQEVPAKRIRAVPILKRREPPVHALQ